jgi:integrase
MSVRIPKYRKHHSGQARVTLAGTTFYLGKYGTPDSRRRYKALINEWLARTGRFAADAVIAPAHTSTTVNEAILAYLGHAQESYRTNPKEVEKVKLSVRPLRTLFGRTPAAAFDAPALEAVRSAMIESGLARTTTNERVRVIKRPFRWAARVKLAPASVSAELLSVEGLKRGRSRARETEPVRPVPPTHVEAVLPAVNRHVRGMVQLQLLTGARPGEVCLMRRADIDMSGGVWIYHPMRYKNQFRGQGRDIFLGPQAQQIVESFFRPDVDGYLFSPRLAREERYRELRARRKSRVPPSQMNRRKAEPKKIPGERYTTRSYYQAVRTGCEAVGVPPWHRHQLRHNAATKLRREFGSATEIYAEADERQAVAVIARIG